MALHEFPTWLLISGIYGGWSWLIWHFASLPWWVIVPGGAWFVAWHNSFQHEAVHGHPSRHAWLNAALAWPPLSLWIPYPIYRDSHLAHHAAPILTDPVGDPESYYLTAEEWARVGRLRRAVLIVNNTLAGRVVVGPWLIGLSFWRRQIAAMAAGDLRYAPVWLVHIGVSAAMLWGLWRYFEIAPLQYVLMFAWPGFGLSLVRSFHEHRPAPTADGRTAIVDAGPLMSLLFLNNNLHQVHHERPGLPWFALRRAYREDRDEFLQRTQGFHYPGGYLEIARRYAVRPKDMPVLPCAQDPAKSQALRSL